MIANVLLCQFDRVVEEGLSPIYYGRYVDDIFLVIRDTGGIHTAEDLIGHLVDRIPLLTLADDRSELRLHLPYGGKSNLIFRREKQRIFHLSGEAGKDLLDTIKAKIDEVSSEWRLLPDLDDLESSPAARVLTASKNNSDEADSLRKADNLSIRRLGFALMLRSCDALARDLPPAEWQKERHRFYRFAAQHVLTPMRLLDLHDYVQRLVSLAVACADWEQALKLVRQVGRVMTDLEQNVQIVPHHRAKDQWIGYRKHQALSLMNAILKSLPLNLDCSAASDPIKALLTSVASLSAETDDVSTTDEAIVSSTALFWADLARTPFKDMVLGYVIIDPVSESSRTADVPASERERAQLMAQFLANVGRNEDGYRALLYPTRALTAQEVTECLPLCSRNLQLWSETVRLLRGTWVNPDQSVDRVSPPVEKAVVIGAKRQKRPPRIAVTSFLVEHSSWACAAGGAPDLSNARYKRLVRLANLIVRTEHRPDYVVFPELSIPRRWIPGLAHHFLRSGISLIAGVEYERVAGDFGPHVVNEAKLFLTDDRLGYPAWCVLTQRKGVPAHGERDALRAGFGLGFPAPDDSCKKWIYDHRGFCFGVFICSELTDVKNRQLMRGRVDAEFVLSWNQDLESFASLVEASSLDSHCFMVLVNNRKYGDSRVRAPYKEAWKRDMVRVKGGLDDYFVVTDLDVNSLRDFQSHAEPPAEPFKPTPEGFTIAKWRRRIPGGGA